MEKSTTEHEKVTIKCKKDVEIQDCWGNFNKYKKGEDIDGLLISVINHNGTKHDFLKANINGSDTLFLLENCKEFIEVFECKE